MTIDSTFSPHQRQLQHDSRQFARSTLSRVGALTRGLPTPEARFRATRPIYEEAIAAGFLRRLLPEPFGGEGHGMVDMAIITEEFHAVDVNVSLTMLANLLGLMPIFAAGSESQRERWVTPFLSTRGSPLAALANSEPGGSANFAAPAPHGTRTTARLDGDEWVIDGAKHWVSASTGWEGDGADVLAVVCRTPEMGASPAGLSIIVVPRGSAGLEHVSSPETFGHRAHLTPRVRLNGVRVPHQNVVGPVGGAKAIVEGSFTGTAAIVGMMSVALMRAAFAFTLQFCKTEARGGPHPIIQHQAVGYGLADAKSAIEACRSLAMKACDAMDKQVPGAVELALHAKVFCSETAVRVITDLIRLVGIDSYDLDLPLAGLLQDAMVLPIFDGGNIGVRRRQLHALMMADDYDPLAICGSAS